MNDKEIFDGNKLIAEFMQLTIEPTEKNFIAYYHPFKTENGIYYSADELLYHKSYDWLMSVVEKIINADKKGYNRDFFIHIGTVLEGGCNCYIESNNGGKPKYMKSAKGLTLIEATYGAIIKFIKWYNNGRK